MNTGSEAPISLSEIKKTAGKLLLKPNISLGKMRFPRDAATL